MSDSDRLAALEAQVRELQDWMEIRRLKWRYVKCNDGGWPGKPMSHLGNMHELFVEDGVWDGRPLLPLKQGRAAIKEWIDTDLRAIPFAIHNVMLDCVDIDGDRAHGTWQFVILATLPDQQSVWMVGNYHEDYVRTQEGWRYQHVRAEVTRTWPQEKGWGAPLAAI
ncbi:MAG: nuclear transport factor 2 family protein [Steroidobacteraceae bacterium]